MHLTDTRTELRNCPICEEPRRPGQASCSRCGVDFRLASLIEEGADYLFEGREAEAAPPPVSSSTEWWDEQATRAKQSLLIGCVAGLAGFFAVLLGGWIYARPIAWHLPLVGALIMGVGIGGKNLWRPMGAAGWGTRRHIAYKWIALCAAVLVLGTIRALHAKG